MSSESGVGGERSARRALVGVDPPVCSFVDTHIVPLVAGHLSPSVSDRGRPHCATSTLRTSSGNTRMGPEVGRVMTRSFAVTWDYRCPFARNAHEHLLAGLEAGADWDVRFLVFSLDQTHVEEGGKPVWEEPDRYPALLANLAGVVVRDRSPEQFHAAHFALFAARHDQAMDLRDPAVVAKALDSAGVDAAGVLSEVEAGWPLEVLKEEHSEAVGQLQVFGVPTFISADDAVFVRLMNRPLGDSKLAISTIDRVLDVFEGWPELNEFKHTKILR